MENWFEIMVDFKSQPVRELAITYTNYEDGYDVHQMKMAVQRAVKGVTDEARLVLLNDKYIDSDNADYLSFHV